MKRPVLEMETYFNDLTKCPVFEITQSVPNVSSATVILTDMEAKWLYKWLKKELDDA